MRFPYGQAEIVSGSREPAVAIFVKPVDYSALLAIFQTVNPAQEYTERKDSALL
jgi:hypothetical protein